MLSSRGRGVGGGRGGGVRGKETTIPKYLRMYVSRTGYLRVYFRLVGALCVCPWTKYPLCMFSCPVHFNANLWSKKLFF